LFLSVNKIKHLSEINYVYCQKSNKNKIIKIEIDTTKKTLILRDVTTLNELIGCIERFADDDSVSDYKVFVFQPGEFYNNNNYEPVIPFFRPPLDVTC